MVSSILTIDIAPFGTYPSYLAARLGGLKAVCRLSQLEAYGKFAKSVEDDGDRDESVEIGPIGNVVNLSAGALRETPVEFWGNVTWNEMSAVAKCSLDIYTAELPRIEYKPPPAGAKRIVGELIAAGGGAARE